MHFFPEPDSDDPVVPELLAALDEEVVTPWRIDAAGVQWYKTMPPIHGVEPGYFTADDDEADIEAEGDDEESIEFFCDDEDADA